MVQKNGTPFCIKNAKLGVEKNKKSHAVCSSQYGSLSILVKDYYTHKIVYTWILVFPFIAKLAGFNENLFFKNVINASFGFES